MTLFWLLCVIFVFGGLLAFGRQVREALEGLALRVFGTPARAVRVVPQAGPARCCAGRGGSGRVALTPI